MGYIRGLCAEEIFSGRQPGSQFISANLLKCSACLIVFLSRFQSSRPFQYQACE